MPLSHNITSVADGKPACRTDIFRGMVGDIIKESIVYIHLYIKPVLITLIFPYKYITDITESIESKRQENRKERRVK